MQDEKLKRIESIEKELAELKASIKKESTVESYPCVTPIDSSGDILFNGDKQSLYIDEGLYSVCSNPSGYQNCKDEFVWIPCKREDLEEGDTAFRTNKLNHVFSDLGIVCKILDTRKYIFVGRDEELNVASGNWNYWYKLVRKDSLCN